MGCRHNGGVDLNLSGSEFCQGSMVEGDGGERVKGVCKELMKITVHGSCALQGGKQRY